MLGLKNTRWTWFLGIACTSVNTLFVSIANAQITPDTTLPNNSDVNKIGNINKIEGGTTAGSNLFHSFKEFSIPTGSEAHFNNAVDINNIITRVTGKSISNIDGLIKANGTANLFLINPSGIVFGENASLDIGGSFVGSTADAIGFGEDDFFSASSPESSSLLEVNPNALFFNQVKAASIQNNSVAPSGLNPSGDFIAKGLRVPDGKSLMLVGGDININGGGLYAFGGRVELGGVTTKGTVVLNENRNNFSLSFPDGVEKSDVSLSNGGLINVRASDGGNIIINAQNFEMKEESFLFAGIENALGSDDSRAGNIDLKGKQINIDSSFIVNQVLTGASGRGGNINIDADTFLVRDGALVSASTFGRGRGGNLTINARDVRVIGKSAKIPSFSKLATQANPNSTGDAGNITINTDIFRVEEEARVSTSTFSTGNGGNLFVNAKDIQLIGVRNGLSTSAELGSTGNAGDLKIQTNTLLVKDGAKIDSASTGEGKGGNVTIDARNVQLIGQTYGFYLPKSPYISLYGNKINNILLDRNGTQVDIDASRQGIGEILTVGPNAQLLKGNSTFRSFSGLFTSTDSKGDAAGDITINTDILRVEDGAQVSSSTAGKTKGGNLTINGKDVQLIGGGTNNRVLTSLSTSTSSTADAGDLKINTDILQVKYGAGVSTGTNGKGKAGNLTVDAQKVELIGESRLSTSLSASTSGAGNAGDIEIKTDILLVENGAYVTSNTSSAGKGGDLTINARDVQINNKGRSYLYTGLFTETQSNRFDPVTTGNAGNLTINTDTLQVEDGAEVSASTNSIGKGGNLNINARYVRLGESNSTSTGLFTRSNQNSKDVVEGDAGNLKINTDVLRIENGARASAETFGKGDGGNLIINAQQLQIVSTSKNGRVFGGLFTSTQPNSTGDAGDLTINTDILQLENRARASVESLSTGKAGNLIVNARSIRLNNDAVITASTQSPNIDPQTPQATITINSQDLILRRGSRIRTDAEGENVVGGNININSDVIAAVPNENSDISANSQDSRGGNIKIQSQGIYGTQFRDELTPKSDITATGASPDLSGFVEIITPDINPNSGLVNLPTIPVETEVAQVCAAGSAIAQSKFKITELSGLPTLPNEALTTDAVLVDLVTLKPEVNQNPIAISTKPTASKPKKIIEATGFVKNKKGEIFLVADASNGTNRSQWNKNTGCGGVN